MLNTLAKDLGISSGVKFAFNNDPTKHGGWSPESGIMINPNSLTFSVGNYYDFTLVLKHEKQHSDTPGDHKTAYSEYEAYKTVVEDPNFSKASPDFRLGMISQYEYYKQQAGM